MSNPTLLILLYFIMPLWVLAGAADWLCHRRTDIAHTAGPKESVLHLMMFGELAVPLLAALFLEINALVFLVMIAALVAHQATAMWDVAYAAPRRHIVPNEQHVHSLLEMLPLMAVILVAVLNWPQFLAVFGLGSEAPRWAPAWHADKLPVIYVALLLAAALLFDLLPYVEELRRGLRAGRQSGR